MAPSMRTSAVLLTTFATFGAAAPAWGGGNWNGQWPGQSTTTATAVQTQVAVTTAVVQNTVPIDNGVVNPVPADQNTATVVPVGTGDVSPTVVATNAPGATNSSPPIVGSSSSVVESSLPSSTGTGGSTGGGDGNFTPGKKAGVAGGDGVSPLSDTIGWFYDWSPEPQTQGNVIGVSMLWGGGSVSDTDKQRFDQFNSMQTQPDWLLGFNEPDCSNSENSANLDAQTAADLWNNEFKAKVGSNTKIGSPALCSQAGTWLDDFKGKIDFDWDFTTVHLYQNDPAAIDAVLEHFAGYGKKLWITEWACVDVSSGFTGCTDQDQINTFVDGAVKKFEEDDRVAAYAAITDGYMLSDTWNMVSGSSLTTTGNQYKTAINQYAGSSSSNSTA